MMIKIKALIKQSADHSHIVQAVSDIEALVQAQDPWSYRALMDLLAQDSIDLLIAVNESQQVMGYCLYQQVFEQSEILRIGTHPDYQRQGIAAQLMGELHQILQKKEAQSLMLEVRADNAPAIALYTREGFVQIYRRVGYYQVTDETTKTARAVDALIMQLNYQ